MSALLFLASFSIVCVAAAQLALAAPDLQISSPQNGGVYGATSVVLNVTSNETVDFFFSGSEDDLYVERSSSQYLSTIYGKKGQYNVTIHANNSNGVSSAWAVYNITAHNPIHITSGGTLVSSDAEYVLDNDIGPDGLLWGIDVENISVDLNGFTIDATAGDGIAVNAECSRSKVFNGTLLGSVALDFSFGCLFKDIVLETAGEGVILMDSEQVLFDDVSIEAEFGVHVLEEGRATMHFRNSRISGPNGNNGTYAFFHERSELDSVLLEETVISNFSQDVNWADDRAPEYTLRNSKIFIDPNSVLLGTARVYLQHKAVVNTTNSSGFGVPVVVEVTDASNVGQETSFDLVANPTASQFVATNDSGLAEVWLTERVDILRTQSPLHTTTVEFDPYQLRATTKDVNATVVLNITSNSTFKVPISLEFPVQNATSVGQCTLAQMLDLDGDGDSDSRDMKIIVDYMVGKPVDIVSVRNCKALVMTVD